MLYTSIDTTWEIDSKSNWLVFTEVNLAAPHLSPWAAEHPMSHCAAVEARSSYQSPWPWRPCHTDVYNDCANRTGEIFQQNLESPNQGSRSQDKSAVQWQCVGLSDVRLLINCL